MTQTSGGQIIGYQRMDMLMLDECSGALSRPLVAVEIDPKSRLIVGFELKFAASESGPDEPTSEN